MYIYIYDRDRQTDMIFRIVYYNVLYMKNTYYILHISRIDNSVFCIYDRLDTTFSIMRI